LAGGQPKAAALVVLAALLAPSLLSPFAGAGLLATFAEGPDTPLDAAVPTSWATASFPNPVRAVNASLNISTEAQTDDAVLGAPERGWWAETAGPMLGLGWIDDLMVNPLSTADLAALYSPGGQNWTVNTTTGKPAAVLEFNVTGLALARPFGSADMQVVARTDGATDAEALDIEVAFYVAPFLGPPGWRSAGLLAGPVVSSGVGGIAVHPATRTSGTSEFLAVLVAPRSEASRFLTVDAVSIALHAPRAPVNATLIVSDTGESVWRFAAPDGRPAPFGWTNAFEGGSTHNSVPSNGSVAEGYARAFFAPANATIRSALVEIAPRPSFALAGASSGGTHYLLPALSTAVGPLPVSVPSIPVVAHPFTGTVTLFNLTAHSVLDARQETNSSSFSVGNFSSFEQGVAQTVTLQRDGTLESVSLNLGDATGHPIGPLLLEVRNVSGGAPGTSLLSTGSMNATTARPGGWVTFALTPALAVLASEDLALVLASPGAAANETWDWRGRNGVITDPYSGGTAFLSLNASGEPPWAPQSNTDMAFRLWLSTPFNESEIAAVSVAGATGPALPMANYSGPSTGFRFLVQGLAVQLTPDFMGGAFWNATLVNSLPYAVDFEWTVSLSYYLFPRNVEVAVGNRTAFLTVPELAGPLVVEATAEFALAFALGETSPVLSNGTVLGLVPLRLRADGPADVLVFAPDLRYDATVPIAGLAPALNRALATVAPGPSPADILFILRSDLAGSARLSALNVLYSEPPVALPSSGPPVEVLEGAQNVTIADLYQWFVDDLDGFRLNYTVEAVFPALFLSAAIFESGVDGNLTVTSRDQEYSGPASIRVRAADSGGLSAERIFDVIVLPVADAPWILPIPDFALASTTGTLDLAPYIRDNDTAVSSLSISVSSVFARRSGLELVFDYRQAPASLLIETVTLWANDGTTNTSATFRVLVNNAGRPVITTPPPIPATEGHNLTILLDPFVSDDRDADGELTWGLLRVVGVGAIPGDATARVDAVNRTLKFRGTAIGDVEVGLTVEDSEHNLAAGILLLRVTTNLPPSLGALDGLRRSIPSGGELRLNISEYLTDADDAMANFTFSIAWDNGSVVTADREGGVLVIRSLGGAGGHAEVTLVATDPAGAFASATVQVDAEAAPGVSGGLLFGMLGAAVAVGVGGILFLSYRKGRGRQASLGKLAREDADIEADEDERERLSGPEGLEESDEEKMDHKLEELEKEAGATRHALPPVTIIAPAGARTALELVLAYRDGRPMSWARTSAPEDADTEKAQELAAALETRARAMRQGGRIEGETLSVGGRQFLVEARSQLVLAALPEPGANAAALRMQMRAALDAVFDANALPLKRWDGSRAELKGVEDALEGVLAAGTSAV